MEKTAEKLKVNESLLKTVLCSATFWGLLAHGMVLFNKYSFHDDVRYFNEVGATYESGRWMLGILGSLSANLLGSKNYSLPVVNGTITILCIAAIVYLLVDSLKIQSKPLVILLCGSMVTFPSVTGTFSYMFTAPYYYAASLLGVVGAWIFHQKKNVVALLLCTVLMACSVGVYQANIPVCICTLLLYMMEDIRQSDMNWKAFWKMALCNATVCIGFVTEYFLVNQYFLNQFGVVLTDYKGINHFGRTNLSNYIYRILCGYGSFFYPSTAVEDFSARYVYTLLIIVTAIIAIFVLRKMYILKTPKGCQTLLILIAYPIAACFVYLMVEPWDVHAVMTFGQAFAFKSTDKNNVSVGVRGPVSIHQAVSISPVEIEEMQITKSVNGETGEKRASDTMGMKHFVRFGLYEIKGAINVQLAEKTGFTREDAAVIKECLRTLFVNDASSARPEGSMEVVKLYWWEHNGKDGQ